MKRFKKLKNILLKTSLLFFLFNLIFYQIVFAQTTTPTPPLTPSLTPTETILPTPFPSPTETPISMPTPTLTSTITPTTPNPIEEPLIPTPSEAITSTITPTVTPFNTPIPYDNNLNKTNFDNEIIKKRQGVNKINSINSNNKPKYKEGEVIVKFKPEKINLRTRKNISKVQEILSKYNLSKKGEISDLNLVFYKGYQNKKTSELIDLLKQEEDIEYVEPNYIRYINASPNDSYFTNGYLWGLYNYGQTVNGTTGINDKDIDAPEAWDLESSSQPDVIIAVLDTGVNYNHSDLSSNMWNGASCKDHNNNIISGGCPYYGWDYLNNDNNPIDDNGHGTHVAGIIGQVANNSTGGIGISYYNNLKIMVLKIGNADGSIDSVSEIYAINFAKYNGAKVINASFGSNTYSTSEKSAIDSFPGLFVAAAGNDGLNNDSTPTYPCNYTSSNIICVAATDQNDNLASFSNYGTTSVDLGAPGVNIHSSYILPITILNENFNSVTPPNLPSGWTKMGDFGTYDYSGDKVLYGDYNSTPYDANANYYAYSPTYNLSGYYTAFFSFFSQCDTEYDLYNWTDYMSLQTSPNGLSYTEILRWDEPYLDTDTNPFGFAYQTLTKAIPYSDITNSFKFLFYWHTNSSVYGSYGDGCYVDDLIIKGINSTSNTYYSFLDGTSMATPYVAGAAGMLYSYKPTLTDSQVKSVIMNSGDSVSSLSGKTVSGKRLNLYNALASVTNPSTPVASPIGGTHYDKIYVTLSSTNSTSIRYTTDGSDPTCSSGNLYSSSILISTTTTLKAIGCNDYGQSSIMTENYTISSPASTWYLAEGYTGGSFTTYILIQNPNDSTATVNVTYMISGSSNVSKQYTVGPNTRYTINANNEIGTGKSFSTKVTSNQNIIVERAMYWDGGGIHWVEGHCSSGIIQ